MDPNLEIETCYLVYAHGTSQDFVIAQKLKIDFPFPFWLRVLGI